MAETLEKRMLLSSTPAMVADIAPGAAPSNPSSIVQIGSTVYFAANDGAHGTELWKSSGTAASTVMVKDIAPGGFVNHYGTYVPNTSNPGNLTNVNGTLFFTANDGVHGDELWKSDGTTAGTIMVDDIHPGSFTSYPTDLTNVNGTLFFAANDGVHGDELWESDGTAAGTVMVKDIASGGRYYPSSNPGNLTNVNGTLFFTAHDNVEATSLWKSDGTAAGTVMLANFAVPGARSSPDHLTNVNGTLFFTADDGVHGDELWKSDGTVAGTTLVSDIYPGGVWVKQNFGYGYQYIYYPNNSNPTDLTNVKGTLFFTATDGHADELWKSNGTEAGTVLVADINPGYYSSPANFANVNGTLFFTAEDGVHGDELWKSDGTAADTGMVKEFNPGSNGSAPTDLTSVSGTLFFTANDGTHGAELWQSDGTAAGTRMVADINPGSASSSPANLTNVNGALFFTADDGVHGTELWSLSVSTTLDPLAVLNTNDSGPGSLRQVISYVNGLGGPGAQTITFDIPAGPQTINLLSPLPAANVPLIAQLDGTQNVTVALSLASAWNDNNALTVTGAGSLAFIGGIDGPGDLTVDAGSSLTANCIVQSALVIGGTAGSPATVTIAASDSSGNPFGNGAITSSLPNSSGAPQIVVASGNPIALAALSVQSAPASATNQTTAAVGPAIGTAVEQNPVSDPAAVPLKRSSFLNQPLPQSHSSPAFDFNSKELSFAELPLTPGAQNGALVDVLLAADNNTFVQRRSAIMTPTLQGLTLTANSVRHFGGTGRVMIAPEAVDKLFLKIGI
jgi:ELWxxDGT repeat protein